MALTHNSKIAEQEPDWSKVDTTRLPAKAFAFAPADSTKSDWKYPHHWVKDGGELDDDGIYTSGEMYLHKGGLNAAWSAANGGRSGEKADAKILAHLDKHRQELGIGEYAPEGEPASSNLNAAPKKNVAKYSYVMEIYRSNYASDGRGWTSLYTQHVYENTILCMEKYGLLIPVHKGHENWNKPMEEETEGYVKALRIKDCQDMPGEKIIEGDIQLQGSILRAHQEGTLPNRSVEIVENYVAPDGKKVGEVIVGLALLGAHQPALTGLKSNLQSNGILNKLQVLVKNIGEKLGIYQRNIKEAIKPMTKLEMTKEQQTAMEDALNMINEGLAACMDNLTKIQEGAKMLAGEDTTEPKEEEATTDEAATTTQKVEQKYNSNAEVKALQAKTAALEKQLSDQSAAVTKKERDEVFNRLHSQGKITTQEREVFDCVADGKGLVVAEATYSQRVNNTPTNGGAMNMGNNQNPDGVIESLRATYKRNGFTDDVIDKRINQYKANPMNLQILDQSQEAN